MPEDKDRVGQVAKLVSRAATKGNGDKGERKEDWGVIQLSELMPGGAPAPAPAPATTPTPAPAQPDASSTRRAGWIGFGSAIAGVLAGTTVTAVVLLSFLRTAPQAATATSTSTAPAPAPTPAPATSTTPATATSTSTSTSTSTATATATSTPTPTAHPQAHPPASAGSAEGTPVPASSTLWDLMWQSAGKKPGTGPAATAESTEDRPADLPPKPSTGAVQGALGAVVPAAKKCLDPDDPISHATVTFQSDGTVQNVSVTGGGAGGPAEACIRAAMMRAHVPPFSKPLFTASATIRSD